MRDQKPAAEVLRRYMEKRRLELKLSFDDVAERAGEPRQSTYSTFRNGKGRSLFSKAGTYARALDLKDADHLYAMAHADQTGDLPGAAHCLIVGHTPTLWFQAFGTGRPADDIRPEEFRLNVDLSPQARLVLDAEISAAVARTEEERKAGQHTYENNRVFFMHEATWSTPRGPEERPALDAVITTGDYAIFYTLTRTVHGRALLRERMKEWRKGQIIPALSGGLGIGVAILSSDGKFVFGRREITQGPRPQQLDVGAVEGFSPTHDFSLREPPRALETGARLDVDWAARRGLLEEYGIEHDEISSLHFLGFGCDLEYGQWNIMALAKVTKTSDQIERRRRYAKHQEFWETLRINNNPSDVFATIANDSHPVWSFGIALAFMAMVHSHGKKKTETAAEDFDLRPKPSFNDEAAPA